MHFVQIILDNLIIYRYLLLASEYSFKNIHILNAHMVDFVGVKIEKNLELNLEFYFEVYAAVGHGKYFLENHIAIC